MGTIIGAAVGAATVIIFGKWLKGRDFIGLAAAFFILALVVGFFLAPSWPAAQRQIIAHGGTDPETTKMLASFVSFLIAYFTVTLPGGFFVLLADKKTDT